MVFKLFGKEIYIRKSLVVFAAVVLLATAIIIGHAINNSGAEIIIKGEGVLALENEKGEDSQASRGSATAPNTEDKGQGMLSGPMTSEAEGKEEEIKVYVVGCVKNEGIVTLKKGQLIDDAIKAAGGATEDADIRNINLVYKLTDNVMLRIKSIKESQAETQDKAGASAGAQGKSGATSNENANIAGKGIEIISDSGGAIVSSSSESGGKPGKKININTASIDELDTLPGIGESTARKIIEYRQKNGDFKSISDIMQVSGIGTSKFNKIKDFITID